MTELLKFIQANEAFKSDLLKSFVTDYKGRLSQPVDADPAYVGISPGASFFAPLSALTPPTTTITTTTTTSTTSSPAGTETDNANANIVIQEDRTDNVQTAAPAAKNRSNDNTTTTTTTTTQSNQNTINANRTTTTTSATTTTTTTSATCGEEPDSNANVSEVAAVLTEMRSGPVSDTQQLLVQQVTEATVEAHQATCINTHRAVQEARSRFTALQEAGQLPDMGKLSLSAGAMWETMMEQLMPEMGNTIKFFKLLPGFTELCLDDQMLLIKQGMFEVMLTRFAMLIDHEKETMLDPSHKMVCPRHVVQQMPMGKFLDGFFRVGAQFNPLGLKDSEIGVFTAVLALSPSRLGLKESRLICIVQSVYLRALFTLMKQNHSDAETKFSQVLGLGPMLRRMSTEHSKALESMKKQSSDAFDKQFPPLHKELYVQEQ